MQENTQVGVPTYANTVLSKHFSNKGIRHCRNTFFQQVVTPTAYPFFEWNDRIYQVIDDSYVETTVLLSDVKPGGPASY